MTVYSLDVDQDIGGHRVKGRIDLTLSLDIVAKEPSKPPTKPAMNIQRALDKAKTGDVITVPDGIYYEPIRITTPGITLKAETPGEAIISGLWREANEGKTTWRPEGKGVYSSPHGKRPYIGAYDGRMLFSYNTRADLEAKQLWTGKSTVNKPSYGYAFERGRVFLRLPNDEDPNGKPVALCEEFQRTLIRLENAPNVTIDGVAVVGAGNTDAITSDRASHHLTLRNIVSTHNRRLAAVSDYALVEWSDYSYAGMYRFADDLLTMNGDGSSVIFDLVKTYYSDGGNAFLEGGLCEQVAGVSSKSCEFRYNRMHQCFDGMRLGAFHESKAHHNVFDYCYDDAIEFEHWRESSSTSKNEVYENLILNPHASAFSHADPTNGGMHGPHFVYRNVVWITNRKHSHPPYLIKNRRLTPTTRIYYWHNTMLNYRGFNGAWGSTNQIWWRDDGKNDQRPENITLRNNILLMPGGMSRGGKSPDSAGNVLVNDVEYLPAVGRNGVYAGKDIAHAGLKDPSNMDFSLKPDSRAIGAGQPLEAWWPKNDAYAGGYSDAGAFPAGEAMPENWPRPNELVFSR